MISLLTQMHLEICNETFTGIINIKALHQGDRIENAFFKWDRRPKKFEKPWHRGLKLLCIAWKMTISSRHK